MNFSRSASRVFGLFLTPLLCGSIAAAAVEPLAVAAPRVITVKGVYLKNDAGKWVKIIEPDHRVDLSSEEPTITFFNNQGRVPPGGYKNFRIDFSDENSLPKKISSIDDFPKSIYVQKGSFVRVSFSLPPGQAAGVEKVTLTVDRDIWQLFSEALKLEA